jgi:histidine kinase
VEERSISYKMVNNKLVATSLSAGAEYHHHHQINEERGGSTDRLLVNFTRLLEAPDRLYGRDKEISELIAAHDRIICRDCSSSEVVLLSGSSGTGKSCLVAEASKHFSSFSSRNNSNNNAARVKIKMDADGEGTWAPPQEKQQQEEEQLEAAPIATTVSTEESLRTSTCSVSVGCFLITGKFDQMRGSQPYSALSGAFTEFCDRMLALEDKDKNCAEAIKSRIRNSVGTQGRILTQVIPSLDKLLDIEQEEVVPLGGNEARNRFNFAFRRFARAIAGPTHPMILFLDDLQWADEASLDLLATLVSDFRNTSILLIGAYRDDEVSSTTHPLSMQLREIERKGVPISRIRVGNLTKLVLNQFIADLLRLPTRLTWTLTDIVHSKTEGNPLFVVRFLKYLRDSDHLTFNLETLQWEWDVLAINSEKLPDNVVEMLAYKISKLPKDAQDVLKMAAATGNYFDEYTLKLIFRSALVDQTILLRSNFHGLTSTLKLASSAGLIKPWGKLGYKFSHDRVQQSAYSLIPEKDRPALHLKIGRLLSRNANSKPSKEYRRTDNSGRAVRAWASLTAEDIGSFVERMLFVAVDQLNKGSDCIESKEEITKLVKLNLKAGERAIQSSAFVQAEQYLISGLKLIEGPQGWEDQYDLTVKLSSALAEAKYCTGNFEETKVIVGEVIRNARTLFDKLRVYSVNIKSLGAQSKVLDAIDAGFQVLAQLGEPFPDTVGNLQILMDLLKTKAMLVGKSDDSLRSMPVMESKLKIAAMQVLCSMLSFTYMCRPQYVVSCLRRTTRSVSDWTIVADLYFHSLLATGCRSIDAVDAAFWGL